MNASVLGGAVFLVTFFILSFLGGILLSVLDAGERGPGGAMSGGCPLCTSWARRGLLRGVCTCAAGLLQPTAWHALLACCSPPHGMHCQAFSLPLPPVPPLTLRSVCVLGH